jgi:polysaccharide deacetylase 2 family uncharacterized protein YibQ
MPPKRKRKKPLTKRYRILLVLLLVAAGTFFFFEDFGKEKPPESFFDTVKPEKKPKLTKPERTKPERSIPKKLPRVAIVIDDLGPSKKLAAQVLNIGSPITLSILPQQSYTVWIAEQGKRRGLDVIVHLPMEATRPLKLGEGGLYTWMSDSEIKYTVEENIRSVPYITGASNHMGSAFTKDARAMEIVVRVLKSHGLFFLDSLTTPESVAFRLAQEAGITAARRDVFLDDSNSKQDIEVQWNRLIKIARKEGHAIALGHPRENTIEVLENVLRNNKDVVVVPLSDLIPVINHQKS